MNWFKLPLIGIILFLFAEISVLTIIPCNEIIMSETPFLQTLINEKNYFRHGGILIKLGGRIIKITINIYYIIYILATFKFHIIKN